MNKIPGTVPVYIQCKYVTYKGNGCMPEMLKIVVPCCSKDPRLLWSDNTAGIKNLCIDRYPQESDDTYYVFYHVVGYNHLF